jgi:hypothetical protein
MADGTENQADRYNTDAIMGDVQGTEAERVRETELAAHERGTVRDLEPHGAAGGAVGRGGEETHQQLCGTTRKGTYSGTKMPE